MMVFTCVLPATASARASTAARRARRALAGGQVPPAVFALDVADSDHIVVKPAAVVAAVVFIATDDRDTLRKHARPRRSVPPVASRVVTLRTRPPPNCRVSATCVLRAENNALAGKHSHEECPRPEHRLGEEEALPKSSQMAMERGCLLWGDAGRGGAELLLA